MEHLRELRSRIFKSLLAIALGSIVGWVYFDQIFSFMVAPLKSAASDLAAKGLTVELTFTSVTAPFTLQVRIAAMAGVVLASPVWIYQIWGFITPALHKNERRYAYAFIFTAVPLFLAGVGAALWVLPKGLELLIGFTPESVSNLLPVDTYLMFLVRTMIVFGIGFLIPIFIVALNLIGILPSSAIKRSWRWTVLAVFLFGAIATPTGDPISMMLLAGPMLLLILIAFGICALNDRRKARRSSEPDYDSLSDDEASSIGGPDDIDGPDDIGGPDPID
jgi:sec-independent protein translocase protein TatC